MLLLKILSRSEMNKQTIFISYKPQENVYSYTTKDTHVPVCIWADPSGWYTIWFSAEPGWTTIAFCWVACCVCPLITCTCLKRPFYAMYKHLTVANIETMLTLLILLLLLLLVWLHINGVIVTINSKPLILKTKRLIDFNRLWPD